MSRVSCLVKTSEFALACAARQAIAVSRVSGLMFRENLKGRGSGGSSVPTRLVPDGRGWDFVPNNGVITFNLNRPPTEKKTEGLQYQQVPNVPQEKP